MFIDTNFSQFSNIEFIFFTFVVSNLLKYINVKYLQLENKLLISVTNDVLNKFKFKIDRELQL